MTVIYKKIHDNNYIFKISSKLISKFRTFAKNLSLNDTWNVFKLEKICFQ